MERKVKLMIKILKPIDRYSPCFVCYVNFVPWYYIQFGFHVDLSSPNMEIFLPFLHIKIGYDYIYKYNREDVFGNDNCYGIKRKMDK